MLLQQEIILPPLLTVYEGVVRFHYLHPFPDQLRLVRFVRVVWQHQTFVWLADFGLGWRRWGVQMEYCVVVFHLPISPIQFITSNYNSKRNSSALYFCLYNNLHSPTTYAIGSKTNEIFFSQVNLRMGVQQSKQHYHKRHQIRIISRQIPLHSF